tara:strand:+ start:4828 stop:5316 length:489 start_codon:yes stop_codon:yes gene_type:complete
MKITPENKKLLVTVSIALASYVIVIKPLLEFLGLKKTAEEKKKIAEELKNRDIEQKRLENLGVKLSKSTFEWDIIANQIYEDLKGTAITDNKGDVNTQLKKVKNDLDILYLIKSFGERQEYISFIPSGSLKSLNQFVLSNLSNYSILDINADYIKKNIKYRF